MLHWRELVFPLNLHKSIQILAEECFDESAKHLRGKQVKARLEVRERHETWKHLNDAVLPSFSGEEMNVNTSMQNTFVSARSISPDSHASHRLQKKSDYG